MKMKKLVAVIAAVVMMVCGVSALAAGKTLTREEAMKAALDYAGLNAEQVTFTKVQRDRDDGRQVWEIEFISGGIEYEMDVDLITGRITDTDRDRFDGFDYDDDDLDDRFDFD